ncbi:MAG: hypothetical protein ABIJ42_00735 [Acidobacteriota bacterium]
MKKYSVILMAIVLIFSFISVTAVAQPSGPGSAGAARGGAAGTGPASVDSPRGNVLGIGGLMGLELTQQQREQIRLMLQLHQDLIDGERLTNREQVREMREALVAIMEDDIFDEVAAEDILVGQAELNLARQRHRLSLQHQILHDILDEEQRTQLQNFWQNQGVLSDGVGGGPGPGEGLGDCPYIM